MDNRFSGKHVLITGAARGIGFEIARQFYLQGARLSLIDHNEENLRAAKQSILQNGRQMIIDTYPLDVADRAGVFAAVERAEGKAPVDVLINNAGIASESLFLEITEEEWDRIIRVNLTGMFHMAQAVLPRMVQRKKGIIINMASKNGLDGEVGYAHYNASKGGVIMLTKTLALEFAHMGIRVNAVCPGYIETPMSKEIDPPEFTRKFVEQYIPMNRPGNVEEIAKIFLFLAGEDSSFITGQVIIADGGQLAGQKPFSDKMIG